MTRVDFMKTIFIVNPCAGQGNWADSLIKKINSLNNPNSQIYITKAPGEATDFVRNFCKSFGGARFIACGGDGTLNEVLNGAIGFEDAEIGVIPVGTGNDFCRNFDKRYSFSDITHQICGKSVKCDAIKYTTTSGGKTVTGYSANMFNIGFDCRVADLTAQMKKKPFISGPLAYFISILVMLITKKGENLEIRLDGKVKHSGRLLLTSVANGSFCGGGIKSNPLASVSDGLISVNIIKNISRTRFLTLLPRYMKGSFLKLKNIEKIILCEKCREISITPLGKNLKICIDGEITDAGKTHFEICPKAFNFVLPEESEIKKEDLVLV